MTDSHHETLVRARFDAWAESSTFQRLQPWLMFVQRNVMERIEWGRVTRFLDIACGNGWAVVEAAQRLAETEGGMACGCDLSAGMLAQRSPDLNAEIRVFLQGASAQALPYRDGAFDALICTAAFHHFPAPVDALKEFRRVLRTGGTLVIADTCRDQSIGTWIWDRLHRWFEPGHVKYYRRDEMRPMFTAAGFGDLTETDLRPSFATTKKLVRSLTLFQASAP